MEMEEGIGAKGLKTKLIINYLPQSMTDQQFRMLFSQIGELESSRVMRDKATGYSFGYGFIDFMKPSDAIEAISKLNGHRLDNKTLRVAYSKPPGSSKNVNLYVGGLGPEVTEDKLLMLFSNHGDIINTKVLRERDGTSKGAGFVLFKIKSEADAAIRALQGYVDGYGSSFQIKYAKDSAEQQKTHPKYQEFVQTKFGGQITQQHQSIQSPYGLSYNVVAVNPAHLGGYIEQSPMRSSYGGGYTTVPYGTSDFSGRSMRGRGAGGPLGSSSRGGGGARFNPMARPVGNSETGYPSDAITRLFVYNIGMNATDGDLYGLFARYGRITKVDVMTGKGYGFVHMPIPHEAQEAVRVLNGKEYNGKILQVSIKT